MIMVSLLILYILFIHWLADFVCQSDWMAKNKAINILALSLHVGIYTAILSFSLAIYFGAAGLLYGLVNGGLHFALDYFSSKCTKKMYEKGDTHNFFVVIGADQFIHSACLILTLFLL